MNKKHTSNAGYTLMELIVVLAIIAMIAVSAVAFSGKAFEGIKKRQFNAEINLALEKILSAKDHGLTTGYGYQPSVTFFSNKIIIRRYDKNKNDYISETIYLKHSELKGNFINTSNNTINFSSNGTVTQGGTLQFLLNGKVEKYIIIQISSGRIYISDQPPEG